MQIGYNLLKGLHVGCVAASYALFVLRGLWLLGGSPRLHARWTRIVPHVIDTALLASAIGLAVVIGRYPFASAWLTAKLAALTVYILLGTVALRWSATMRQRAVAWIAAQLVFFYIVAVAITRNPVPWGG